jgi:hypothetical protein
MACTQAAHDSMKSQGCIFCPRCGERLITPIESTEDYITLLCCMNPQRSLVAVMRFDKHEDSYKLAKCSDALSHKSARALAESWSQALKLEIR